MMWAIEVLALVLALTAAGLAVYKFVEYRHGQDLRRAERARQDARSLYSRYGPDEAAKVNARALSHSHSARRHRRLKAIQRALDDLHRNGGADPLP